LKRHVGRTYSRVQGSNQKSWINNTSTHSQQQRTQIEKLGTHADNLGSQTNNKGARVSTKTYEKKPSMVWTLVISC